MFCYLNILFRGFPMSLFFYRIELIWSKILSSNQNKNEREGMQYNDGFQMAAFYFDFTLWFTNTLLEVFACQNASLFPLETDQHDINNLKKCNYSLKKI